MFNIQEFVRQKIPFVSTKEALKFIASTKMRKYKTGEAFIEQGEVSSKSAYIAKGVMRAFVNVDGEEKTVLFRKEGEFIGAPPSMFRNKPAKETVVAVEDCLLMIVDWEGFRDLAGSSAQISKAYSFVVEDMMLDAVDRIEDFTILSPEQRYLKFIKEEKDLLNRVQLKHIASFIGISEVSLSRMRARLAKRRN
jgi:CRP-like cAMP-binding protein